MSSVAAEDRHAAVRGAFVQWASTQLSPPRDPQSLITSIDSTHDHAGFLSTSIRGRRLTWKSVPANNRARITVPRGDVTNIDPWTTSNALLRTNSDHIDTCSSCHGAAKVQCNTCGGTGYLTCGVCKGQRKMYGYASNGSRRLLNCTHCRGKGALDCGNCRKGIASCSPCGGQGRVQRWLEIDEWERFVATSHPPALVHTLRWSDPPRADEIAHDADLVASISCSHRITETDAPAVNGEWLRVLARPLQAGERIVTQYLRIARVPTHTVRYRLGEKEGALGFVGKRLTPSSQPTEDAFRTRAGFLRTLLIVLLSIACTILLISLGRGGFYWSIATFISVASAIGALAALYYAAADWTATRRHTRQWLSYAGIGCIVAIVFAVAAQPRLNHIEELLAAGDVPRATAEIAAYGEIPPAMRSAFDLARIRATADPRAAIEILEKMPRDSSQYAEGRAIIDTALMQSIETEIREQRFDAAADSLSLLSPRMIGRADTLSAVRRSIVPYAQQEIASTKYASGAQLIRKARDYGLPNAELTPLIMRIHEHAQKAIRAADRTSDAKQRLRERLAAEAMLVSADVAEDTWGSPELMQLRTKLAKDIVAVERIERRRRH